jgi:hypothetical protein
LSRIIVQYAQHFRAELVHLDANLPFYRSWCQLPNDYIASASDGGTISIFSPDTPHTRHKTLAFPGPNGNLLCKELLLVRNTLLALFKRVTREDGSIYLQAFDARTLAPKFSQGPLSFPGYGCRFIDAHGGGGNVIYLLMKRATCTVIHQLEFLLDDADAKENLMEHDIIFHERPIIEFDSSNILEFTQCYIIASPRHVFLCGCGYTWQVANAGANNVRHIEASRSVLHQVHEDIFVTHTYLDIYTSRLVKTDWIDLCRIRGWNPFLRTTFVPRTKELVIVCPISICTIRTYRCGDNVESAYSGEPLRCDLEDVEGLEITSTVELVDSQTICWNGNCTGGKILFAFNFRENSCAQIVLANTQIQNIQPIWNSQLHIHLLNGKSMLFQ